MISTAIWVLAGSEAVIDGVRATAAGLSLCLISDCTETSGFDRAGCDPKPGRGPAGDGCPSLPGFL